VAANVTIVQPSTPGWMVLYPTGPTVPGTSSVNATSAGEIAASLALVASPDGVSVYAHPETDAVVDVTGVFTPTRSSAVPDGTAVVPPTTTTTAPPGPAAEYSFAYTSRNWTPTAYDTCPASLHES
ncbi:MAG TPA: hypothetical protein PLV68_18440, partial [Ilumatobacteraceae bacterium]|nr:hypothetical protein [Ilumatobacteraceae bacterium]